jgi:hypothetical protein
MGREVEDDDDEQEDSSKAKTVNGESTKLRRMRQWKRLSLCEGRFRG